MVNKLILGDNLEILKGFESESVDLIYLDPPFFSNRNYEVIWGDDGEIRSFQDRWAGGMDHYIGWLRERVEQMHRILKPSGSIFLHCDWHADAYIRVDILDKIFGMNHLRGEIVWNRAFAHNDAKKKLAVLSDTIWYYSKSENFVYHPIYPNTGDDYKKRFNLTDENGRLYQSVPMDSPNPRQNLMYEWKGYPHPPKGWRYSKAEMEELDSKGEIIYPDNSQGRLRRKKYWDEAKGALLGNVWTDIQNVQGQSKERIGYPTQKPIALLDRIIKMASNEGDSVLDPFMGGGTSIVVAQRTNRRWIGIDQSVQAVKVTELRLNQLPPSLFDTFTVQLHKYDYDTLRYGDAFEFESWIVQQFGGSGNAKQRNDLGLDGRMPDGTPIQVKRSDNIGRNVIDSFKSAAERNDAKLFEKNRAAGAPVGYVIAFSFGRGAIGEVARLRTHHGIIIKLVEVKDIVPVSIKPAIAVEINELARDAKGVRELEFVASGSSEAGIEFYSWDFEHNAEEGFKPAVVLDREGRQTHKFKAGRHSIAVKVVDNNGLENIEVVQLKVNGSVERFNTENT
ncbi:MAG: hypothetical protein LBR08_11115 [Bacteroidales bacterium]|nr:hypothetical protein [Bacteroidales bacterium]